MTQATITPNDQPHCGADGNWLNSLRHLARDIKISHTVFALPFALLSSFLAASHRSHLPRIGEVVLVILCMVFARTIAMATNRMVDAPYDKLNPRTANRAIPTGRLGQKFAWRAVMVCSIMFTAMSGGFWLFYANPWPLALSPLVLAALYGYSFTKRFTWCCHLVLGGVLAISPLAAAIAIEPQYLTTIEPYLLAVMVACWVGGFDIIYALQDIEIDRITGTFSMPANLGTRQAMWISRILHAASIVSLAWLTRNSHILGSNFTIAVTIVAILLIIEHALVWGGKRQHIHIAFFTVNGIISLVLACLGLIDILQP
ncbi:MAG: 4-hydroxybenzoate octaprenyltransferase [Phycisphaeraceae bacterium]|nr:4-hydroxybenzoate octaprenyltransferase [Phycisphaeraceae bacterium]